MLRILAFRMLRIRLALFALEPLVLWIHHPSRGDEAEVKSLRRLPIQIFAFKEALAEKTSEALVLKIA
jgi:hypothetical protein